MADPRRIQRIQSRVRQDIAELLLTELKDPRLKAIISITRVEVTNDLSFARVYWSVLGGEGDRRTAERFLEGAASFIQGRVSKGLEIRTAPKLVFHFDDSIEKGVAVSKLIDEAMQADARADDE